MPDKSLLLDGKRVIVTSGGTREPIDPVRYLGNRSSGKMGNALAQAATRLGARVTMITTVDPSVAPEVEIIRVGTAREMHAAIREALPGSDVLLMAAAVADYRPAQPSPNKLKKRNVEWPLVLVPTDDILASLRDDTARNGVFVVGFAAETDDLLANAQGKLRAKGLDLIVLNDVGRPDIGMGADENEVTVIDAAGIVAQIDRSPKSRVADQVLRIVAARLR